MKRVITAAVKSTQNQNFNEWYWSLSQPEKNRVDDIMEHNCFDFDTASDVELDFVKKLYLDSVQEEIESKTSGDILEEVKAWADNYRIKGYDKFEKYGLYIEKHSIQDLLSNYVKYFNRNVSDYGDGFAADWDDDDWMAIRYRDGKIREINPQSDDGKRKISVDNIDSIILTGSWGVAVAGPNIDWEDYTVYDDIVDIRPEFYEG